MIFGITSYLPDNEELRKKRIDGHTKQINFLKSVLPEIPIYVVAQNYKDTEYLIDSNIKYIKFEKGIGPANARNELLKMFYNSNEDYMYLLDDDIVFYDYYNILEFFKELHNIPNKYLVLDVILSRLAQRQPFKKDIYEQPLNLSKWIFIDNQSMHSNSSILLKNFKKYYDKEIYYQNLDVNKLEGHEDMDFNCKLRLANIKMHTLQTFITTAYNYDDSSIYTNHADRVKLFKSNDEAIYKSYADTFLFKNGHLNKSYRAKPIIIDRTTTIILPDNLIPDYKQPTDTLF